jgi:predicted lipoprotein with Yx(FWY)xxD motif
MTLYYFRPDAVPGVSVCDAECLANWPPATFAEGQIPVAGDGVTGVVNMTTTTDGQPIATYDGRPLYYFVGDEAAGDTNGQGLGDVWFVALVDGSMPAPAPAEEEAASPAASPAS